MALCGNGSNDRITTGYQRFCSCFFCSSLIICVNYFSLGRLIMYFDTNTFCGSPLVAYFTKVSFLPTQRMMPTGRRIVFIFHVLCSSLNTNSFVRHLHEKTLQASDQLTHGILKFDDKKPSQCGNVYYQMWFVFVLLQGKNLFPFQVKNFASDLWLLALNLTRNKMAFLLILRILKDKVTKNVFRL